MRTLANTEINRIVKVRSISDGTVGYATEYGTAGFGGRRLSVLTTYEDAKDCDVSNDVGAKMIDRCVRYLSDWEIIG